MLLQSILREVTAMKMEFLLSSPLFIHATIFAVTLLLYCYFRRSDNKVAPPPEVGGAWPLIGHLHMLKGFELPHVNLGALADQYGPIFTIRVGVRRAVVVSSWEFAKECFTTNDLVFNTRPKGIAAEVLCYDNTMFGFTSAGPYYREMRKIASINLLSGRGLARFKSIREYEINASLKKIYDMWEHNKSKCIRDDEAAAVVVEMKRWFWVLTLNIIGKIVLGKREEETEKFFSDERNRWNDALVEFFNLKGMFLAGDAIPWLRWLDFGGYEKAMKKTAKDLDLVLQGCLEEHQLRRAKNINDNNVDQDFMDIMLSICGNGEYDAYGIDSDVINKATCLTLIVGASDSSTATLTWALALLLNNRHALQKAREEIDQYVGKERQVKESDLNNLVYLQAIVKETLRLYPPTMLSPPREAMENCTVGGFHVSTGTRLILNLWKLHRDPRVWSDPFEFQPERFLTTHKDVDTSGRHFQFLPFGSGRKVCVGMSFALKVIELGIASLIHGFELKTTATKDDEPIDMTPSKGFTNHKATPLRVILTPRLSAHVYT